MNRIDTWRNRLAWRICNWVLAHIADDSYSSYIGGAIRYGMDAAAADLTNGHDPLGTLPGRDYWVGDRVRGDEPAPQPPPTNTEWRTEIGEMP